MVKMEERTFKCASCRKEIMFFDILQLPGKDVYDEHSGLLYNTAKNYCKNCYEEMLGNDTEKILKKNENVIESNKILFEEYFKVKTEWDKLDKKKNELGIKIKDIMTKNNLPRVSFDKFDAIVWKSKCVNYFKKKVEEIVPEELLDKIRTISERVYLKVKSK